MRPENRALDELRPITFEVGASRYAEGSCLVKCGQTHVLVTASVEERLPPWMRGQGRGWVTGEYGMLPRATHTRNNREAARGKQGGRTVEIQRLIGRSLRAVVDLEALGERQITIDCDVIQADGGTRTAAITGGYVALKQACDKLVAEGAIEKSPIIAEMAAVSAGIVDGECRLDLEYVEDSAAQADANFVLTSEGGIIEVQASAEDTPFSADQMAELTRLAVKGVGELCAMAKAALG
jgi:ribonuclease PH